MDVAVEDRRRPKPLHVAQRPCTVFGPPAPLRVNGPERHVSEDDYWRTGTKRGEVFLHPCELLRAQHAERRLPIGQVCDVHQAHEMDTLVVKALPPAADGAFAESLTVLAAVVDEV